MTTELPRRVTYGVTSWSGAPIIGIATSTPIPMPERRADYIRVLGESPANESIDGYAGIVTRLACEALPVSVRSLKALIHGVLPFDHIRDGDILRIEPGRGAVRSLYRVDSPHNTLFATERCNSNCLMCSQPPKPADDTDMVRELLRLVRLIPRTAPVLGITGGEPTLLGEGLFNVLEACRDQLPETRLHMLTNGRRFKDRQFAERLAAVNHPNLVLGIPLYSDFAHQHDYVVQARGAFDETMIGFHNLASYGQRIEIRVVVHKQTYRRLRPLVEFIYRNCPFAEHVALMGLEITGYTKPNLSTLWIDPVDYQDELESAVSFLAWSGMHVSIYNHPLCILRRSLWPFARKSISDWKNIYLDACKSCGVLDRCGGLFKSAEQVHSKHIAPIAA